MGLEIGFFAAEGNIETSIIPNCGTAGFQKSRRSGDHIHKGWGQGSKSPGKFIQVPVDPEFFRDAKTGVMGE
jgi:hypothetical protein